MSIFPHAVSFLLFIKKDCFEPNQKYEPLDMPGQRRSTETSPLACQERCQNTEGCSFFSFWDNDGGCHLHVDSAQKLNSSGTISGPVICK